MADSPQVSLPHEVSVVNLGLSLFADAIDQQAAPVQRVDWRIPGGGDPAMVSALEQLSGPRGAEIDAANAEAARRLDQSVPLLVDVAPAERLLPDLAGRVLLHCGPAIEWSQVCDPLRRSLRAATVAEGWAAAIEEADSLLAAGTIRLEPAYRHDTVVPMASAIGPSAPLCVVENRGFGTRAFAPLNQGPGETAWFGRETPAAISRLELLRDVVGPMWRQVVHSAGPIDLFALAAQGVQMGDDVHMRTQGTTNLMVRQLLPHLAALPDPGRTVLAEFLADNHMFFLNLAMAAAKSAALAAEQVEGSSLVTMMCRNGTSYAIRLAGSEQVFESQAPPVAAAMYYPDYGSEDAAPDIGDSAILELVGMGGAAAAGSPAVAGFLPGGMPDAVAMTERMASICVAESTRFRIPTWHGRGTPVGVDVRHVVELDATPQVTTGILHASSGIGQIGAGVASAPLECFRDALRALVAGGADGPGGRGDDAEGP